MRPTLRTRKPIDQLRPEDLKAFPIWEFANDEEHLEGRDETWVRPVRAKVVPADSYSLSVAATFTLACERELPGLVGVSTADGIELGHAALLTPKDYVFVPSADYWNAKVEYRKAAASLGLRVQEVLPLRFTLAVVIEGEVAVRSGQYSL